MKRLLFLLLFLPALSFSKDYYWVPTPGGINYAASTPGDVMASLSADYGFKTYWGTGNTEVAYYYIAQYISGGSTEVTVSRYKCPFSTVFNDELKECTPEPDQCEAGQDTSYWKFFGNGVLSEVPTDVCLLGCDYVQTSSSPCMGPVEKNGVAGNSCKLTYTSTGDECSSGSEPPGDDAPPPDTEENTECKKFVNVDGSWGFDCNPKPDPDPENNSCPPGYIMQGTTCFRIPPDHPDYDPDKDPNNPKPGDGDGDKGGDYAKDSTLKEIDKTLKDIDKTTKATESAIKTGDAVTHNLLQGIKDAIGNIPGGGGGGNQPGGGDAMS